MKPSLKSINLVLRLDDFSEKSNIDFELQLVKMLKKYNLKCTFGVIPFVCNDRYDFKDQNYTSITESKFNQLNYEIDTGVIEIALHGFAHQTKKNRMYGHVPTEFYGVNYSSQLSLLKKGKNHIESIINTGIDIFIPPWNTYDENTLKALNELAFKGISTGKRCGPVDKESELKYLPGTCKISELRDTIKNLELLECQDPFIVVWFHEYDFYDVDSQKGIMNLEELDQLFEWVSSKVNIKSRTIGESMNTYLTLNSSLYKSHAFFKENKRFLPAMMKSFSNFEGYYRSQKDIIKKKCIFLSSLGIYYLLISSASYFFAEKLSEVEIINKSDYYLIVMIFITILSLLYVFKSKRITYKNLNAFFAILGIIISLF